MNKNQLLSRPELRTPKTHIELQTHVAAPKSLYPESAPIAYYSPQEIITPKKSNFSIFIEAVKRIFRREETIELVDEPATQQGQS